MAKRHFHLARDLTEGEKLVWAAVFAQVAFKGVQPTHDRCLDYQRAALAIEHASDAIATLRNMGPTLRETESCVPRSYEDGPVDCCYIGEHE